MILAPVVVDLGPDVGARDVQIVIDACNRAIVQGVCLPEASAGDELPRAVAVARAVDGTVRVVRIEVRLASDEGRVPIVRELVFGRRDPLRERWRTVGLAIATLVGEGERARDEARDAEQPPEPPAPEPPPPESQPESPQPESPQPESPQPESAPAAAAPDSPVRAEPAPPAAAPPPEPERAPAAAPAEEEDEAEEAPEVPREPFEHRSLFFGVGGFTGPGFGAGAWRVGGTLRGAWQGPSGLSFGAALGYAWRASSRDFTAEWMSLEAGVGYRWAASDALSFGAMLLGGAQRVRFEVVAAGAERAEARWNPHASLALDGRWRASPGFGVWASADVGSVWRSSRLFLAPERDPIQSAPVDVALALGLGWWFE